MLGGNSEIFLTTRHREKAVQVDKKLLLEPLGGHREPFAAIDDERESQSQASFVLAWL
jgi:hypothetical protein